MKKKFISHFKIAAFLLCTAAVWTCAKTPNCSGIIYQHVKIIDSSNKAVLLDTFYTISDDLVDTLRIEAYPNDSANYYPVIDDRYAKQFEIDIAKNYTFFGIKGIDTIRSPYVFKYDGCHIATLSGAAKIIQ